MLFSPAGLSEDKVTSWDSSHILMSGGDVSATKVTHQGQHIAPVHGVLAGGDSPDKAVMKTHKLLLKVKWPLVPVSQPRDKFERDEEV